MQRTFCSVHLHHNTVVTKHNYYFIEGSLYYLSCYSLHFSICKKTHKTPQFFFFFRLGANALSYCWSLCRESPSPLTQTIRFWSANVWRFSPRPSDSLRYQWGVYNLTLTLSTWRQHQIPQAKGSVPGNFKGKLPILEQEVLLVFLSRRQLKEPQELCARNQGPRPICIFYCLTIYERFNSIG